MSSFQKLSVLVEADGVLFSLFLAAMKASENLFMFDEIVLLDRWAAQETSIDDEARRWNKVFGGEFSFSHLPLRDETESFLFLYLYLYQACTRVYLIRSIGSIL